MVKLLFILFSVNILPVFRDNGSTLTYFSMFVCTVFLCSEGLFQTSLTFGFYSKTSTLTYLDELFA